MRWNVEGADERTGKEGVFSFEANSSEEAEQRARDRGVLVSAVYASVGNRANANTSASKSLLSTTDLNRMNMLRTNA